MAITLERIPHDKQVAIRALQLSGYSNNKIAKMVDVSRDVPIAVARLIPANMPAVDAVKKQLINENYGLAIRAHVHVTDEKLDKMNALQLTTIAAIGVDKARDLEGSNRPVFNMVTVVNETQQALARLQREMPMLSQSNSQVVDT